MSANFTILTSKVDAVVRRALLDLERRLGLNTADIATNTAELALIETGAWASYTPTVAQGASTNIAKTINYAQYSQIGKLTICSWELTLTAGGTAGSQITVTMPVAAVSAEATRGAGSGQVYDSDTTNSFAGVWHGSNTTQMVFSGDWSGPDAFGLAPAVTLASGDILRGMIIYQAA